MNSLFSDSIFCILAILLMYLEVIQYLTLPLSANHSFLHVRCRLYSYYIRNSLLFLGSEVLIEVVTESLVFRFITVCSPLKANRFHCCLFRVGFLLSFPSTPKMEAIFSSESRLTFNGLHGVISQKIQPFSRFYLLEANPHSQ
jgi:hypothetical protein